jgi:hypothetical protein
MGSGIRLLGMSDALALFEKQKTEAQQHYNALCAHCYCVIRCAVQTQNLPAGSGIFVR